MSIPLNKAPGSDKVPIKVMRDCLPHVLDTITGLINLSFENNIFPRAWKKAEGVSLLKAGDHGVPNNSRPISLLPVLSKVAERIALRELMAYVIKEQRLTRHQSGNRQFHSTETLSLHVSDYLFKAVDEKRITVMILIDLSKALIAYRR